MNLFSFLKQHQEPLPDWLSRYKLEDAFPMADFLESRIVYYPGSGTDGHPVKVFGSTHSAHCFIYADYGLSQSEIESALTHPEHGFIGYKTLARIGLKQADLTPRGWASHLQANDRPRLRPDHHAAGITPYGFVEILEREPSFTDEYGAHRLAIMFLGANGIATYDALFCQANHMSVPFAMLLQDHGFGGNYDHFGADSLLETIANRCQVFPRWMLVAEHTKPWQGYKRIEDLDPDKGGQHHNKRFLYQCVT